MHYEGDRPVGISSYYTAPFDHEVTVKLTFLATVDWYIYADDMLNTQATKNTEEQQTGHQS
jgi:hypothetical protein